MADALAPTLTALQELARTLKARAGNGRLALALAGERDWTGVAARAVADALGTAAGGTTRWLSDRGLDSAALPAGSGTRLIGTECDLLVVDAWSGLDPDGLGAASGTLRGGGLLVLLSPPLADWPHLPDPEARRIAVWPERAETCSGRFVARLAGILASDPAVTLVCQGAALPSAPPDPPGKALDRVAPAPQAVRPGEPATADQEAAVLAIEALARGRARRPLVLTAHRGRGKSAALGIAAGRLMAGGLGCILVTAPRRAACESLFRHARLAWPQARPDGGDLVLAEGLTPRGERPAIRFLPPDALREARTPADLLLVDEAAGIPAPLLADLLAAYPRVVFATTVHGYEGTGRGFDLRFRGSLDRLTPGWRALTLETPIRWGPGDPLESLVFRALLLDAAAADVGLGDSGPTALRFERLSRTALAADETALAQVFGLLVLAHYQTRPLDLRMLLDGPNVRVYVLRRGERVAGTLLTATEGGMEDPSLRAAIFDGRRRPQGHLLPQTLSAHAGLPEAPGYRYLRVLRIAVHPSLVRRGLGRLMLRHLFREARRERFDLLGASFGGAPDLIAFWSACGMRPAQIGTARNAASGEHAIAMLRPATPAGWTLARRAERRLETRLPVLLAGPLRRLDPRVAAALVGAMRAEPPPPERTEDDPAPELVSFAHGHRTLEAALPALAELIRRRLGPALRARSIDLDDGALLVAAARQLHPPVELAARVAAAGRDDLLKRLRSLTARLLVRVE